MRARDFSLDIAEKRSEMRKLPADPECDLARSEERSKEQLRAVVEHPSHVVKRLFWNRKARYRGLAKNAAPLLSLLALANLVLATRVLSPQGGQCVLRAPKARETG